MALPVSDSFTGTTGTALHTYNANWIIITGSFEIYSNTVIPTTSASECSAYWNGDTFDNNQYAQGIFGGSPNAGAAIGLAVRGNWTSTNVYGYYGFYSAISSCYLYKNIDNTWTQLGSDGGAPVVGDTMYLEANGTTITVKNNGSVLEYPAPQTDNAIASGHAGISGYNSDTARLDDWSAGNLSSGGTGTLAVTLGAATLAAAGELGAITPNGSLAQTLDTVTTAATGILTGIGMAGTNNNSATTGASATCNAAPNVLAGDILLACVTVEAASPTITPPANWNLLWNTTPGTRAIAMAVYYKVATGSEASSYTWTVPSGEWAVGIVAYRKALVPTLYTSQGNNSTAAGVVAPTLTTGPANSWSIFFAANAYGTTYTPPTNYGERLDVRTGSASGNISFEIADRLITGASTAIGTLSGTAANGDYSIGGHVVLAPYISTAGTLDKTLDAATLSAAGTLALAGTLTKTLDDTTLSATGTIADVASGSGTLTQTLQAITLNAAGIATLVATLDKTLDASTLSSVGKLAGTGTLAKTLADAVLAATGYALTGANINGVLTVDSTNPRYFRNNNGIVVLSGFQTWYMLVDGGVSDPPPVTDYTAWLDFCDTRGTNTFKLWAMETTKDWPDELDTRYTPHPFARTGPSNAADGKLKFDLTQFNQTYFDRLRERTIQAGNRGYYVIIQLFQGWHVDDKGLNPGNPWAYHPFENGNNINSIDGDTNNDGAGDETRSTSFTAVYNIQKSYVAKVIDTINDLDNVLYEISNEDGSYSVAWQHALIDYIHTYEAGKTKQHPVGMTVIWPNGDNADLTSSNAEWISPNGDLEPDLADGSKVVFYDTDHLVGLTTEHLWVWKAFCQGNNPYYMDEYDGAFGNDTRSDPDVELIRYNLGYIHDYAARMDMANAVPHSSLASTGYCIAKTTEIAQFLAYQSGTGNFTVTLTGIPGTFSLEWLRISDGTVQAGSDVAGNGVRTLTPPWSGEVVAFLQLLGTDGTAAVTLTNTTLSATGVLPIVGTETSTLDAVTLTGTGTLAILGTTTSILANLTLAAAGASVIAGTLAKTLADTTLTASGYILIGATVNGVLTVNTTNGRYVENSDGPLVLTGFHTWYSTQDGGASSPPPTFGWSDFLADLVAKGVNFTKLWRIETARDWPTDDTQRFAPHPWARTGPGNAADGLPKFDLTQWDHTYFTRILERAITAGNAGIYVDMMLFDGFSVENKGHVGGDPWAYHPFNAANNINSINGDPSSFGDGRNTHDGSIPTVVALQEAYVAKVIDTLNHLDNVIWEISNESGTYAVSWEYDLIDYIRTYEAGKPKQHLIGMTKLYPDGDNADLTDSTADWISLEDDLDPDEVTSTSFARMYDTDHAVGDTDTFDWAMRAFTRGYGGVWYMDPWNSTPLGDTTIDPVYIKIRHVLGYVYDYAARMDMANAVPHSSLASTGYCIAKTTGIAQFLAYQSGTGNFTVTLTGISGTFSLEWLRVSTGTVQADSNVAGNGVRTLTPPWSGEVVAFLELIGVNGTLTATLAAATLSAAGTLPITGTSTPTLAALTLSAAGVLTLTATLAKTLDAATLAGTGTLALAATLVTTLEDLAGAATGALAATATLAKTLDALTLAGAGTLTLTATLTQTLGETTLATTGALTVTATLTQALDSITLAAAGQTTITATLAKTLDDSTVSAAGHAPAMGGTLAKTFDDSTVGAAGALALRATVAKTLDALTLSAAGGAPAQTSSLAQTLDETTSTATGNLTITAILAQELEAITLTATSGAPGTPGALLATLADSTVSAAGILALRATVAKQLDDLALNATGGAPAQTGSLAATLDNSTVSAASALAIHATLALTLETVALVSTGGAPTVSGTLTETLETIAIVATGSLTLQGTSAKTLDDAILTATGGASAIAGALATILNDLILSAAGGADAITGTLATALDDLTLGAVGNAPNLNGSLSATLSDLALSAIGKLAVAGSQSETLDTVTLSATGQLTIIGALTTILADITLGATGIGSVPIVGMLADTLDEVLLAAASKLALAGSLNQTLDQVLLAAVGGTPETASGLEKTLGAVTLAATATLSLTGAASLALQDTTLDASAALPANGALTLTLDAVSLTATGIEVVILALVYGSIQGAGGFGSVYGPRTTGTIFG